MAFLLSKTNMLSHLRSHSQKTEDSLSLSRRGFHVEPGAREKALLTADPALKPFKSHKKSVWRLKRFGDVLTIVVVAVGLQQLEELTIVDCTSVEDVFEVEGLNVEETDAVLLPMLKTLELDYLPKLKHLFNEKVLFPSWVFQNLKVLTVSNCGNLRNLFSLSMARVVVHLENLIIENCEMMEEIAVKGENKEADRRNKIVIPRLKCLELYSLPNLTSFCQSPFALDLPLLQNVLVDTCPKMKALSFRNLSTPKLEEVQVSYYRDGWKTLINNTIQELTS